MPEGPEVQVMARGIHREVQECFLVDIRVDPQVSRYQYPPVQLVDPQGLKVLQVVAHGKRILFLLTGQVLISFLGMEGKWQKERGKHSGLELVFLRPTCGVLVRFSLFFDDSRHFGSLTSFSSKEQLNKVFSTWGPDPLQPGEVSLEVWTQRIRSFPHREIGVLLLDQSCISGIGNYLRAEILYAARISPFRIVSTLTLVEMERLWSISLEKMRHSLECGGLTIRSYWDIDGKKGTFPVQVYGKDKDPFGNPIANRQDASKRRIWWVPSLQL